MDRTGKIHLRFELFGFVFKNYRDLLAIAKGPCFVFCDLGDFRTQFQKASCDLRRFDFLRSIQTPILEAGNATLRQSDFPKHPVVP